MNIPNYLEIKVIDEKGYFTPQWKIVMQQLLTELQNNASNEGLVAPSQDASNITTIQNNQVNNPAPPPSTLYTCQFGTLLYDSTNNLLKVALSNAGVPDFKTIMTL